MDNIFDHLLSEYNRTPVDQGGAEGAAGQYGEGHFVRFCKRYFDKNPAVTTVPVDHGVGIRLSNGTVVAVTGMQRAAEAPTPEQMAHEAPAVQVSGGHGSSMGKLPPAQEVPVTGPGKKPQRKH